MSSDETTTQVLKQFYQAFISHDQHLLDKLLAEDCALETIAPAPNGSRYVGRAACLEYWSGIASNEQINFELEETWVAGDRGVIRWRLRWGPSENESVRGVTVMRLQDGLIVEALGYMKGAE